MTTTAVAHFDSTLLAILAAVSRFLMRFSRSIIRVADGWNFIIPICDPGDICILGHNSYGL